MATAAVVVWAEWTTKSNLSPVNQPIKTRTGLEKSSPVFFMERTIFA